MEIKDDEFIFKDPEEEEEEKTEEQIEQNKKDELNIIRDLIDASKPYIYVGK